MAAPSWSDTCIAFKAAKQWTFRMNIRCDSHQSLRSIELNGPESAVEGGRRVQLAGLLERAGDAPQAAAIFEVMAARVRPCTFHLIRALSYHH